MDRKSITIKGVDADTVDMLRDIRMEERRQLSVILADCVNSYLDQQYESEISECENGSLLE